MVVIPAWLNQIPNVDFGPERQMLMQLETWATENNWTVSDGSSLPSEFRQRTDVLFERPEKEQSIRAAVLQKSRSSSGVIRLDSSTFRTLELVYRPRQKRWRVEAGSIPIEDDVSKRGWRWLTDLLFKP
jgi:hypothetical protein